MGTSVKTRIEVRPTGAALGADILGADFDRMDEADFAAIHQAWLDHLVLRFRGVHITDPQHVAFSRRFGTLDFNPGTRLTGKVYVEGIPEIVKISNIVEDGKAIGELGNGEAHWHTDMCFIDVPPAASILRALEVPPSGGDTSWANMYRAYEILPADLKRALDGRSIKHDGVYTSEGRQRPGTQAPATPDIRDIAGAVHPAIRTHPVTGRKAVYAGKRLNAYVMGLPVEESEEILDRLWDIIVRPELTWTQVWQNGDMVMWDNRCCLHRRESFDPATRRLMHRTVVKGERPV